MKKILLAFSAFTLLMIPGLILAAIVTCDVCTLGDFLTTINNVITLIVRYIIPSAAVLFLTIGGIVLLISGGKPELKSLGKKILVSTVIGMALAYGAWVIISFILSTLGAAPIP